RFDNKITVQQGMQEDIHMPKPKEEASLKSRAPQPLTYKDYAKDDEELVLMLQAFLYSADIENAYKVATIGYKKHPNSYYWNQKRGETAKWLGKYDESMDHMIFLYNVDKNEKLRNELITYGISIYQYDKIEQYITEKVRQEPTEKNFDTLIFVYSMTGKTEESARILKEEFDKDPTKRGLLTRMLRIYIDLGELESAREIVDIIDAHDEYTLENTILVTYYYYLERDMEHAYESLLKTKDPERFENIKYNEMLSDLSWYVQDYKRGAGASKNLMLLESARLVDYERIIYVYQKDDITVASRASKEVYQKFKITYLFYGYANAALDSNEFDELRTTIEDIDSSDSPLKNESLYWIIKAKVYAHYNQNELRLAALQKALMIDPGNFNAKSSLFWFFMENNLVSELMTLVNEFSNTADLSPGFYIPLASAYLYLQDVDRADYYLSELVGMNSPLINGTEFQFLSA
ncbi:MAG: tetratricopeptide repeat protein, partial [Epsilonproteobacteria bacterium]|nr:tetratricopeptide repeat protein [Campylobacterota bacterium]